MLADTKSATRATSQFPVIKPMRPMTTANIRMANPGRSSRFMEWSMAWPAPEPTNNRNRNYARTIVWPSRLSGTVGRDQGGPFAACGLLMGCSSGALG
jgi:hypothetical protein